MRNNVVHFGNRNTRNHMNIKLISADILQKMLLSDGMHPATRM